MRIFLKNMLLSVNQDQFTGQISVASDGSIYFPRFRQVYRLNPDKTLTHIAGIGGFDPGHSGDGGPAVDAEFDTIRSVSIAPDGSLYILDRDQGSGSNGRIRKVSRNGIISTITDPINRLKRSYCRAFWWCLFYDIRAS